MLIKSVGKGGTAVPYNPEEALTFAVEYGVKSLNSDDKIFWVVRDSVKKTKIHFRPNPDGTWEAMAEGIAAIGHTDVKTDRFHEPRQKHFFVEYKPSKDSLGLPDIAVVKFHTEEQTQ